MSDQNILEVRDLNVAYGGIKAVKGISFDVPRGEVVTLIGANGEGAVLADAPVRDPDPALREY